MQDAFGVERGEITKSLPRALRDAAKGGELSRRMANNPYIATRVSAAREGNKVANAVATEKKRTGKKPLVNWLWSDPPYSPMTGSIDRAFSKDHLAQHHARVAQRVKNDKTMRDWRKAHPPVAPSAPSKAPVASKRKSHKKAWAIGGGTVAAGAGIGGGIAYANKKGTS